MQRLAQLCYLTREFPEAVYHAGADPGIWKGGGGGWGGGGGGTVSGAAPGRVREGGTPPAQLGGMGERCKLPHRGMGRTFCVVKAPKTMQKIWPVK